MAIVGNDTQKEDATSTTPEAIASPLSTSMEDNSQYNVFDFLQHRILTHYPEAVQIRNRAMPEPRMAIVYPTYVCNQDCLWCEYSSENTEHHSIMTNEQLMGLMEDLDNLGVKSVEFCGGGEPSLHPKLADATRDLARRGMKIGILTNGTKLKGDLAEALVDHASYIRVGFDGGTEETVHKVKRPKTPEARYDAVCENVTNMIKLRNERGTTCRISIKVVVDQGNMHEIKEAVELAIRLNVDSVQFKAARLVDSELNAEQAEQVNRDVTAAREQYGDQMTIIGGASKINTTTQCWLTPLQLTVDTLGEVYMCCYYTHRKDNHTIGNCFTDPLKELWYHEDHWKKIDAIEPCECNNLDCRFVKYNEIMNKVMVDDDAQFEFI